MATKKGEVRRLIATIPYSALTANATTNLRFPGVLTRIADARTFIVVNNLNQNSNGNINLVGYDSAWPKPTYAYTGSQTVGGLVARGVGILSGSTFGTPAQTTPQPMFLGLDSLEIQIPIGTTAPTAGQIEVWVVERLL